MSLSNQVEGSLLERTGWCVFGTTLASDGNAKDPAVREKVLKSAGLVPENLVTGKQVHGTCVRSIVSPKPDFYQETDGYVTDKPGIVLGVYTADCMPVFLMDEKKKAVGILHAGRVGVRDRIVTEGVKKFEEFFQSRKSDLKVHLGPHIRDCCYEVGVEVGGPFPAECLRKADGKLFLSLETAVRMELFSYGIKDGQVTASPLCTCSDKRFFSYRGGHSEERMLSFISRNV